MKNESKSVNGFSVSLKERDKYRRTTRLQHLITDNTSGVRDVGARTGLANTFIKSTVRNSYLIRCVHALHCYREQRVTVNSVAHR